MIPLAVVCTFMVAVFFCAIAAGGFGDLWEYLDDWIRAFGRLFRRRPPPRLLPPTTIAQMERDLLDTPVSAWLLPPPPSFQPAFGPGHMSTESIRNVMMTMRKWNLELFGFDLYDGTDDEVVNRLSRYYEQMSAP